MCGSAKGYQLAYLLHRQLEFASRRTCGLGAFMSWFGKKISVAAALAGASLALPAQAQTITDDPLHGFCFRAAPLCQDGGASLTKMTGTNSLGVDSKPQTTAGTY